MVFTLEQNYNGAIYKKQICLEIFLHNFSIDLTNEDQTTSNLITLKEFVHTKYSVLYDNTIGQTVTVETRDGVPCCKSCNADDCGHVGFVILLEQKYETDGSITE